MRYGRHRSLLNQEKLTFGEILQKEALTLAAERLHYFSHWITPGFFPIRYDVRFFVVEAPTGQEAQHDGIELTDHSGSRRRKPCAVTGKTALRWSIRPS